MAAGGTVFSIIFDESILYMNNIINFYYSRHPNLHNEQGKLGQLPQGLCFGYLSRYQGV